MLDGRYEYLGNTDSNTKTQPIPAEFTVNHGLLYWAKPFLLPGRYLYTGGSDKSQSKLLVIQPVNGRQYRITQSNGQKENLAFELDEQGNTKWIDASTVPRAKKPSSSHFKNIGQGLANWSANHLFQSGGGYGYAPSPISYAGGGGGLLPSLPTIPQPPMMQGPIITPSGIYPVITPMMPGGPTVFPMGLPH